jgi:hypothetical protein
MNDGNGRARTLRGDVSWLEEGLENGDLVRRLREVIEARPGLALGAAAGIGFVLGGLPRGALTVLLGVGTRMAGAYMQREFLGSANAQEKSS